MDISMNLYINIDTEEMQQFSRDVDLKKLEDELYGKIIDGYVEKKSSNVGFEIDGKIETTLTKMSEQEIYNLKKTMKTRCFTDIPDYYIEVKTISHKFFSRDAFFQYQYQWDGIAANFILGLAIPILLPKFLYDLKTYYYSYDHYYVYYNISFRRNTIIRDDDIHTHISDDSKNV